MPYSYPSSEGLSGIYSMSLLITDLKAKRSIPTNAQTKMYNPKRREKLAISTKESWCYKN